VVKNVAGYDLLKLFVGSHGSLGVIVEATFKLLPVPEEECLIGLDSLSLDHASRLIESIGRSELTPVVLDLFATEGRGTDQHELIIGFAGAREDVAWQRARAADLGISRGATLTHERTFWDKATGGIPRRRSVLPSELCRALHDIEPHAYVARAGNGAYYSRYSPAPSSAKETPGTVAQELARRVKSTFDPGEVLPPIRFD
jgi:FAD/FMN-containing dehydrogenase